MLRLLYDSQAALALAAAFLVAYRSARGQAERRFLILTVAAMGCLGASFVVFGDTGTITKYLSLYYVQTSSALAAVLVCFFVAGWSWRHNRPFLPAVMVGLYFLSDVVIDALYRSTEFVYDFQLLLRVADHLYHRAVVLAAILVLLHGFRQGASERPQDFE